MKFSLSLMTLSLLVASVDGGASVAADGNCNVGSQASLDEKIEVGVSSDANCNNS